ncbi:uncharacterized protein JCM15063_001734 [Sporobolomyces koalae]|uniref:uncharacterized protein n=1 Tax=Sporobolomyces koalae TaxID=500713 RepID=UPI003170CFFB
MSQLLKHKCFCYESQSAHDGSTELSLIEGCGHSFHTACIMQWWESQERLQTDQNVLVARTCPTCKHALQTPRAQIETWSRIARDLDLISRKPDYARTTQDKAKLNKVYGLTRMFDMKPIECTDQGQLALSSDGMSQDTLAMVEHLHERRLTRQSKLVLERDEMVQPEQEPDEGGNEHDNEDEVTRLRRELREAMMTVRDQKNEIDRVQAHLYDVTGQLDQLEQNCNVLRHDNEALQEELARYDDGLLDDLQADNLALEEDNERLRTNQTNLEDRLDSCDKALKRSNHELHDVREALAKEGDSGREQIKRLEVKIEQFENNLLQARAVNDKLELEMSDLREKCRDKVNQCQTDSQKLVEKYKVIAKNHQEDLVKEREKVTCLRSGNKSWEAKYNKLQKNFKALQKQRGKQIYDSDEDDDQEIHPKSVRSLETQETPRTRSRQPLEVTSLANHINVAPSSTPPPTPTFKIKTHSSLEYLSPTSKLARSFATEATNTDVEDDDDIVIVDDFDRGATLNSKITHRSRSGPSDLATCRSQGGAEAATGSTVESKYFAPRTYPASFPSLMGSNSIPSKRSLDCANEVVASRSDRHLPDFSGRKGVAVQIGPKTKIKRR